VHRRIEAAAVSFQPLTRARERAFLQSVLYAALFDYPLTVQQLREALIGQRADEAMLLDWYAQSAYLQSAVEYDNGHFFPRGRRDLLDRRARREATSRRLLETLAAPLNLISRLPFVRMVALSGSLAHLNGDADADLDLFVITAPRRVWTVTVAALALARLCGWRQRLCLNYVVSERALWVAPADLFSANQIVHLQPIAGHTSYLRFLDANRFVERFYPNFRPRPTACEATPALSRGVEVLLNCSVGALLEWACRLVYQSHLRARAHSWLSRDQVRLERECLKLHTTSHRHDVMTRFERDVEAAAAHAERAIEQIRPGEPVGVRAAPMQHAVKARRRQRLPPAPGRGLR
jgi:hypothetical protein